MENKCELKYGYFLNIKKGAQLIDLANILFNLPPDFLENVISMNTHLMVKNQPIAKLPCDPIFFRRIAHGNIVGNFAPDDPLSFKFKTSREQQSSSR